MEELGSKPAPAMGIFLSAMTAIGVGLLLAIPIATQPAPPNQGWWTEPALMPTITLSIFALAAVYLLANHLWSARKNKANFHGGDVLRAELFQWLLPLEYFIYYFIYIYLLGLIGYFLSSFIFAAILCIRVGLRSRRWIITALFFALALTALFRWGLKIWFPSAELFEYLPRDLRIFFAQNF
ncbi:MAG: tripartite tricarboxylate transporter TctB family protein [Chloroflexota bacterium]